MNNSIVINFAYNFILKFILIYKNSFTYKLLESVYTRIAECFSESWIGSYIKSSKGATYYIEHSTFLNMVQKPIDWFLKIFRNIASILREPYKNSITCQIFQNSLTGKLFSTMMERFVLIISLFIFVHSIVPFHNWHNQYGLALILLIIVLYMVKASGDIRYGLDIKKLDFAFILFVMSAIFAAFFSLTSSESIKFLIFDGMSFILVLVIVNVVKSKEELGTIIYWIIGAITVTCFLGFWQYIRGIPVDPLLVDVRFGAVGRVFSSMGNPNNYAEYLLLTMPFFGAAFFNSKNNYMKAAIAALTVLPLINLYLTQSRGSWIGFVVAVFVFVFLKNMKLIPWLIVLGLAAIPVMPASIIDRLSTIGKDSSSLYRIPIWKGAWRIVEDYWLTGTGLGPAPFRILFNKYTTTALPAHSHMLPLQVWIELGLLGIVSLVWLALRLIKRSLACVFNRRDEYLNNIIIAGISSLAGIFTIGMVEYVWFYERIMTMFWIDVGILMAALNLQCFKGGIPLPKE